MLKIISALCVGITLQLASAAEAPDVMKRDQEQSLKCFGSEPVWGAEIGKGKILIQDGSTDESRELEYDKILVFTGFTAEFGWAYYKGDKPVAMVVAVEGNDGMSDKTYPYQVTLLEEDGVFFGVGNAFQAYEPDGQDKPDAKE